MFGFLNVYKPVGMTSHDVVARFRKLLNIKQIGHTGTLDPFAEGVLPICIGKATRLIEYLSDDKAYLAYIQFGKSTDTYDKDGIETFSSTKKVTKDAILSAIKNFEGEIEQIPPIYSAIKVKGKKLYEYARDGQSVEIKPRKVKIFKIELKEFDEENQIAQVYINCSKGTYIRSIANDLGNILECGAHLCRLIRTVAGKFLIEDSTKLDDFMSIELVNSKLQNPIDFLNIPVIKINDVEHKKVHYGQPIINKHIKDVEFVILVYNNLIDAIAKVDGDFIKVSKVFENDNKKNC